MQWLVTESFGLGGGIIFYKHRWWCLRIEWSSCFGLDCFGRHGLGEIGGIDGRDEMFVEVRLGLKGFDSVKDGVAYDEGVECTVNKEPAGIRGCVGV